MTDDEIKKANAKNQIRLDATQAYWNKKNGVDGLMYNQESEPKMGIYYAFVAIALAGGFVAYLILS